MSETELLLEAQDRANREFARLLSEGASPDQAELEDIARRALTSAAEDLGLPAFAGSARVREISGQIYAFSLDLDGEISFHPSAADVARAILSSIDYEGVDADEKRKSVDSILACQKDILNFSETRIDLGKTQARIGLKRPVRMVGKGVGFERIRRITGYLVGSLDRFNNAKRAEERDRVRHGGINLEDASACHDCHMGM